MSDTLDMDRLKQICDAYANDDIPVSATVEELEDLAEAVPVLLARIEELEETVTGTYADNELHKATTELAVAKLDAIKRLVVETNGDDRIYVDARALNPDAHQAHAWLLHWGPESGWMHGPSGESGTLGEMLHGIASCYVGRDDRPLPPLIGEEGADDE